MNEWISCYESHIGEQAEAMAILKEVFPGKPDDELGRMAGMLRDDRYERGYYLSVERLRAEWPPKRKSQVGYVR